MHSVNEEKRFHRQILLPEVGAGGQEKLGRSSIFIVGCGGLGSSAAYYLAAAGIGKISLADDDRVALSNLNRQILHDTSRIGMPKVASARKTLQGLNPALEMETHACRPASPQDFTDLLAGYDIAIDCTDNYAARYDINDACLHMGTPWIYGAVSGFEGQIMTIVPGKGPCYRCLYPSAPADSDATEPAIGVSPGIIGIIQAAEAIKYILGIGTPLLGRMLFLDMLEMNVSEFKVQKNADCPVCGNL